jgi:membrane protease YdiL (CAAX protease family)
MNDDPRIRSRGGIPSSAILVFVGVTLVITWGLTGFYIVFPDAASARFGEICGSHPFFFLATWAPAIAAFMIVFLYTGAAGGRAFVSRLFFRRCSAGWAAFILIGLPLVFVTGSLIKSGSVLAALPPDGVGPVAAAPFVMLFLGPIEEFGWRGVTQPLLQRRAAPFWAGALIGAIWCVWHLPAFFLLGTVFGAWSFLPFFVGNVMLAVLVTPLFNSSRGSILLPMRFHWQLINPFWPDAQPLDTRILVGVAVIVVWWNRDTLFTREGAVTEVVPAAGRSVLRILE